MVNLFIWLYTEMGQKMACVQCTYGTPNGALRRFVARCHDKTLATMVQRKMGWYC